ncbi:MAG: hypothetical protein AAFO82_19360, partial [Bacteroidota bacterium]
MSVHLLIYSDFETPRLVYITNLLFQELLGVKVELTSDLARFKQSTHARLNYSEQVVEGKTVQIIPHELLKKKSIEQQTIKLQFQNSLPYFFKTSEEKEFQHDLLASSFYLVTRYEEYLPYEADAHGRFPATASLASRAGFLELPVVNFWVLELKKALQSKFPGLRFQQPQFQFQPTLDIDMAWSYLFKGWKRTLGGSWNSLKKGAIKELIDRFIVLARLKKDPYFIFPYLNPLHKQYKIDPIYFFLIGAYGEYDKNISADIPQMQNLIKETNNHSTIRWMHSYG